MPWEDQVPEDWTSKDGRLWRDMSWAERKIAESKEPSVRRFLTKSQRDSRAALLRRCRNPDYRQERSAQ